MNIEVTILILAGLLAVIVQVPVWLKVHRLDLRVKQREAEVLSLQDDLRALCAGAAGVGGHVERMEQQLRRLAERQDQLDLRDPVSQSYGHAIRLVQKGASVEDLVSECGLVRGEAELLMRLHRLSA
ncbi:MAG: DUF2802 domain-containing protein [Gammaproteobacteria bacterium]|jgi:hypothetical protein|nr:DUF2802 domain-containing protein [Gammaproteobacteria bacterium]